MTGQGMELSIGTFHIFTMRFQNQPESEMLLQNCLREKSIIFFADYYLPLENLLFSDEQTDDAKKFFLDIVIVNYI